MTAPQHAAAQLDEIEIGSQIGISTPVTISQENVTTFADLTDDHQWLHIDAERAANGPFGQTVAHGYLLLALLPRMTRSILDFTSLGTVINYGLNKVRFLGGARSGHTFVDRITLASRDVRQVGMLYQLKHEISGQKTGDTVCIAHTLTLVQAMRH